MACLLFVSACNIQRPGLTPGSSFANAKFVHTGAEASCTACHEKDRPSPVVVNGTTTLHGSGGDCVSCHIAGGPWVTATGGYSHTPAPASCAGCHSDKIPVGPVSQNNSPDRMDHSIPGLPDCKQCHTVNLGISWGGGVYGHNPAPASCNLCHLDKKPAGLVPATGPNRMSHALSGLPDCKSCHTANLYSSWQGGVYNHSPSPSTCILCHSPDKPSGVVTYTVAGVSHQFDHSTTGSGDCNLCHTATPGTTWAGGAFNHSPKPTSCKTCHLSDRPSAPVNGFNHSIAGGGDCASCHWLSGTTPVWTGGSFSHASLGATVRCDSCHLPSMPSTLMPANPAPDQMDHSMVGSTDCRTCHSNQIGVSWSGGTFSHTPAPASCQNCHQNKRPTGVVSGFDHASTAGLGECKSCHTQNVGVNWLGATGMPHPASGITAGSALDCASCHGQGGMANLKLTVPAANHMGGTANTCISCHANFSAFKGATTSITTPILKYPHTSTVLSNNCQVCHVFNSGTFNSYSQPTWTMAATTNVTGTFNGKSKTFNHTNANMMITLNGTSAPNCKACHTYKAYSATLTTASARWTFTHRANGVTSTNTPGCKVCH